MKRFWRNVAIIGLMALAVPAALSAQQAAPLQKSDLIRLLTGQTYTKAEVAGIVRRSCLTFTPTERDRTDLRSLGADQAVLDAIDDCVRRAARLELRVRRRSLSASAGSSADLTAIVSRGGAPESGVRVVLEGSGAVPNGAGEDLALRTGADGRATFSVPAGTAAGTYDLRVTIPDVSGAGSVNVQLRTSPAAPARAVVSPGRLTPDGVGRARVAVDVRDAFDNRVGSADVELWDGERPVGRLVASGTTDEDGVVTLAVEADLRGVRRLTVYAGESALASIPVAPAEASASRSGFVAGTEQSADAGRNLPAPLVFEVRDASGAPLADRSVRFEVANGSADPAEARTDASGRATTLVTLGAASQPTEVVASVGSVEARTTFQATIGGLTAAELREGLAEAGRRLEGGDVAGARDAYARLVAANPVNVEALVGHGRALLASGEYAAAAGRFRAALRIAPTRTDARVGLGTASLRRGDREEALRWFELTTREDPDDAAAWAGLAETHAVAGRTERARSAFERALALDPGRENAVLGLARLAPRRPVVEITAWGGKTDNSRDAGPRTAELRIYATPSVSLWGGFDNSLNLRTPYLVRGKDDIEAYYGGIASDWGDGKRFTTSGEFRRRLHPGSDPKGVETQYAIDQAVRFRGGSWRIGGFLGHWGDSNDYVVYTGFGFQAAPGVIIRPFASYGDTHGSDISANRRMREKEGRFSLIGEFSGAAWGVAPGVSIGSVTSDDDAAFDGTLYEGQFRAWYSVTPLSRIQVFLRRQSPPGSESFTTVAVGFTIGVERPRR